MKQEKSKKKYYLGLDIGTDSVGYAVTDESYQLLKHRGEPMWGSHVFEAASVAEERRTYRVARRRLDRRQQRVQWIRELLAPAIGPIDPDFYRRLDVSALCKEDKILPSRNSFFNDAGYTDREYFREYPTIHHLIVELMENPAKHDPRLVYLAVAYLVAHRGHFLSEVDKDNVEECLDFSLVYHDFMACFETKPWECDPAGLGDILKRRTGISVKTKALTAYLYQGKAPKDSADDAYSRAALVKLLAGGTVKLSQLFLNDAYEESISLGMKDEDFEGIVGNLGDDGELLISAKKLYDWSILIDLFRDVKDSAITYPAISRAKVAVYEQHKQDLAFLKYFIRKYCGHETYQLVFRDEAQEVNNYAAYSYHTKTDKIEGKIDKLTFSTFLLKIVREVEVEECDRAQYEDMLRRLDKDQLSFLPKQVEKDNRVIPYQVYYAELKAILENAKGYMPHLSQQDETGVSVADKILMVFLYRIPYYVGPLNPSSEHAWLVRASGKITPWNFETIVDLDASEAAFIRRMTNQCTYLPGEDVIAKNALLYARFEALNEINNITVNGIKLSVADKQALFTDLFMVRKTVTRKAIEGYLKSRGLLRTKDTLGGLDITVKSSLKAYHFFLPWLEKGTLTYADVEHILDIKACSEDNIRFAKWLKQKYPALTEGECKIIAKQKFKEFGRLSRAFLQGIQGASRETGETYTIMEALWETDCNLMQLLGQGFTFRQAVEDHAEAYYREHAMSLEDRLDGMYLSNAVKRPILRALEIISDVVKVNGGAPEKIFVEMARGGTEEQKGNRKISRRERILAFYQEMEEQYPEEIRLMREQLSCKADQALQSEKLYLYFIQLGKCMYSEEAIDIEQLSSRLYDIDHIYPQCRIKDDSLENKVLVLSRLNGEKQDIYPIKAEIRSKMTSFWKQLHGKGLIGDEKFRRLTRSTGFTDDEKWGFIQRQLVETRQSTKAVASILRELLPETEVVYTKAELASEFRQEVKILKSRSVNDLHHAKDAYLNIVVGNVYHMCFTRHWYDTHRDTYSLKFDAIFSCERKQNGVIFWRGATSVEMVKQVLQKNNIHYTTYSFCRGGGLFDQNPKKAGSSDLLIPLKKGMDPNQYGGYIRTTASFFSLVLFSIKNKRELIVMPVELLHARAYQTDDAFAEAYAKRIIGEIVRDEVQTVAFPLGKKPLKINTVFSLDGNLVALRGKDSGGKRIAIASLLPLVLGAEWENYVKRLEKFAEKKKKSPSLRVNAQFDKITREENMALYRLYIQKSNTRGFRTILGDAAEELLETGTEWFEQLTLEEQVQCLLNIGQLFKTRRAGGVDLQAIKGSPHGFSLCLSSRMSNWKKRFSDVRIVHMSASGLFESRTENLLELL